MVFGTNDHPYRRRQPEERSLADILVVRQCSPTVTDVLFLYPEFTITSRHTEQPDNAVQLLFRHTTLGSFSLMG